VADGRRGGSPCARLLALVRSAVSNDNAAAMLREFLTAELLPVIGRLMTHPTRR
jgi:hypothetical protein